MGETIASARRKHTIPFIKLHRGLIILGRGTSRKSAPLIPKDSEIMLIEKSNKMASARPTIIIRVEGEVKKTPIRKHTKVTAKLKRAEKKYFALTRFLAEIGEEYMYHTSPPSEPTIKLPIVILIIAPGSKVR